MKKKVILGACALAICAFVSSCASIGSPVGAGFIITDVNSGLSVTSNNVGSKVGTSSATNILGILATGDASINAAANSAGIKKISHVDQHHKSILGLFSTYETIVYGE